jgi:HEPN domain-containing protein
VTSTFLLVLNEKQIPEYEIIDRVVNKVKYKQPLNLLISYIDYVNEGLEKGQYFFKEIIESGIILYDAERIPFSSPRIITAQERKEMAEEDYELWFDNASQFLEFAELGLKNSIEKNKRASLAAHQLHQAVESFYATVMLVFSSYKPKIHNLDKYRNQLKGISKEVLDIFPPGTKNRHEIELFDLLKRAYIGGKYKKDFDISYFQAEEIIERVKRLKSLVERLCKEKIASFI